VLNGEKNGSRTKREGVRDGVHSGQQKKRKNMDGREGSHSVVVGLRNERGSSQGRVWLCMTE